MITSMSNNKVKRLVALRDKAKNRRKEDAFIVEGVKMFLEAPRTWIREVYVSEGFLEKCDRKVRKYIDELKYEVFSDEVFGKMSDTQTPQGIMCILAMPHHELKGDGSLYVLLEDIQDPGNLGTIMRAGEGAGVNGVIMTRNSADIFNPKVIRSTMGSIYRVPFHIVDDIGDAIEYLKGNGITVYAAQLEDSTDYDRVNYTLPVAFMIGNEGNGLKKETLLKASEYIKIPMQGQVESLNAAVATSILIYEAARQRRAVQQIRG